MPPYTLPQSIIILPLTPRYYKGIPAGFKNSSQCAELSLTSSILAYGLAAFYTKTANSSISKFYEKFHLLSFMQRLGRSTSTNKNPLLTRGFFAVIWF